MKMNKMLRIFLNTIPVLIMIGLIPLVQDDYFLTVLYLVIIILSLKIFKCNKKDITVILFGFVIMVIFEYIFISTKVEVFVRNSLLGVMPLWLPFLWAYGFFAIKRSIEVLEK